MRRIAPLPLLLVLCLSAPASAVAADPLRGEQWGLSMIETEAAHATTKGAGATVAVLDTGARFDHPDLAGRLTAGRDFVEDDDMPQDEEGHGTHVAGIVGASIDNGIGVGSVAPAAKLLIVRVLDEDGSGSMTDVAAGIRWATDQGADVINLSLGGYPIVSDGGDYEEAMDYALDRGRIVVAAAGNDGLPLCEQPKAQGRLLCVGSVDDDGDRSWFSSFPSGNGISAPGGGGTFGLDADVLSTYLAPDYEQVAGTSQAAPHVAGVAALLVSLGVRGDAAVQRMLATATDRGPAGPDSQYGHGIVNAKRAVQGVGSDPGGTPPPSGGLTSGVGTAAPGAGPGTGGSTGVVAPATSGAGRPAGAASTPGATSAFAGSRSRVTLSEALQRGLRVACVAPASGRCEVVARQNGRVVARGSRSLAAGARGTVVARVTAAGRRALQRSRARSVRLSLAVTIPGASKARRLAVTISRR